MVKSMKRLVGAGSIFSQTIGEKIDEFRAKSQKYLVSVVRSNQNARTKKVRFHKELERRAFTKTGEVVLEVVNILGEVQLKEFIYFLIESGKYELAGAIVPSEISTEKTYPPFLHLRAQLEYRLGKSPEEVIAQIVSNVSHYSTISGSRSRKLMRTWAVDLQLWGIVLVELGRYDEAIQKYHESLAIQVLPAALYNIFCCYCRQGLEEEAIAALEDLKKRVDLKENLELVDKFSHDIACDQFRTRRWFRDFLSEYSVFQTDPRGVLELCKSSL